MDFDDRPLLHFPDLVLALLRAGHDQPATIADAGGLLARDMARAREDRPVDGAELEGRLDEARRHILAARLVEMLDEHRFLITPRGRAVLREHPDGIDDTVLMEFPEFRAWVQRLSAHAPPEDARGREFQRGWAAGRDGIDLTDNPYASDTAQHAAWEDGWLEAQRD